MRDEQLAAVASTLERVALWLRTSSRGPASATTYSALDTLTREGALRVSDLAAREGITQPGMTALVNRLTEAGWAEKLADETDRRATLVRITQSGREALAERRRQRAATVLEGLEQLDERHRRAVLAAREALDALAAVPAPVSAAASAPDRTAQHPVGARR